MTATQRIESEVAIAPVMTHAIAYAARGWHVFPVPRGEKKSHKAKKYSNGQNWGATTDPEQIESDFKRWPNANVGIVTGPKSAIWVVEADTKEGHGVDGIAELRELEDEYGKLPETLMAISPSGSLHYYFNWPAGAAIRNTESEIADGVDVRADGGMVIAPPSERPGEGNYKWLNANAIAAAPSWLIELAAKDRAAPSGASDESSTEWGELLTNIRDGHILHKSVRTLAAKLVAGGADGGLAVNLLRGVMELSSAKETQPQRWQERYDDIPRAVSTAEEFAPKDEAKPLGEWDAGDDTGLPPPRGWLLGNIFARKFMSSLLGAGGVGKSALRYAQLLSLATGRSLVGDHVFQRCRVLIVSLEDDADELRRRILAASLYHGIDRGELKDWLFLSAPGAAGGKLMNVDKSGRLVRGALADKLEAVVAARNIDIVSLDPFVKAHSVEENDNSAIDDVVQILTDLGAKYDIATDAPHHISKGLADPGNANRGRGASAMKDAMRLVYTLTTMSTEEAEAFDVSEEARHQFVRMDSGKVNITKHLSAARWYRIIGVSLDNGSDLYPSGDEVQTVEQWHPPTAWDGVDDDLTRRILAAIDDGLPDGNRYTDAPRAGGREAWRVVQQHMPDKPEAPARELVKTWVRNGTLEVYDYTNPSTRKAVKGLRLAAEKRVE